MNPRSIGSRQLAVMFHRSLTALFEAHEQTRLCVVWSPVDRTLEPAERARALTEQPTPQDAVEDNVTEAFLLRNTRAKAVQTWGERDMEKPPSHLHITASSFPQPPDSTNRPLWSAAV